MGVADEPGSWLHFLHVVAAMVWVGGGVVLSLSAMRARTGDAHTLTDFARTLSYVGLRVMMPAVIVVLVTGVWMVLAGSEFKFSELWVLLGLGLFALAFLIGGVYLSRVGIQLERAAGPDSTSATTGVAALLDRWLIGYAAVLLVLLVAVWDMVFKPGH